MDQTDYTSKEFSGSGAKMIFGESTAEGIAGMGAVALAILGLVNILPAMLVSISIIAVGVALAFEGGAISARYAAYIREAHSKMDATLRWSGISALFLAGAAGIALGILALIGVVPTVLIPVAALVFGAALVLDSGANERLSMMEAHHAEEFKISEHAVKETARASAGVQVLVGIGSIVLGILALIGIHPIVLSLVAMLALGAATLITGAAIGGRMARVFR